MHLFSEEAPVVVGEIECEAVEIMGEGVFVGAGVLVGFFVAVGDADG